MELRVSVLMSGRGIGWTVDLRLQQGVNHLTLYPHFSTTTTPDERTAPSCLKSALDDPIQIRLISDTRAGQVPLAIARSNTYSARACSNVLGAATRPIIVYPTGPAAGIVNTATKYAESILNAPAHVALSHLPGAHRRYARRVQDYREIMILRARCPRAPADQEGTNDDSPTTKTRCFTRLIVGLPISGTCALLIGRVVSRIDKVTPAASSSFGRSPWSWSHSWSISPRSTMARRLVLILVVRKQSRNDGQIHLMRYLRVHNSKCCSG